MPDVYSSEQPPVAAAAAVNSGVDHEQQRKDMIARIVRQAGETPRRAVYGAYHVCPDRRFADEQDDEDTVLLLRAHPITNLRWLVSTLVLLIVPQIIIFSGLLSWLPGRFVFLGQLMVYLFALGFAFENFLRWYYSVLIVTNERVVDIDFDGILHRSVAYASLNHIEEPSLVSGGLVRSFFNFGDVNVATAADVQGVEIADVPYPDRVLRIISELSEELEKRRERGE
jgi:hypothetical protein